MAEPGKTGRKGTADEKNIGVKPFPMACSIVYLRLSEGNRLLSTVCFLFFYCSISYTCSKQMDLAQFSLFD